MALYPCRTAGGGGDISNLTLISSAKTGTIDISNRKDKYIVVLGRTGPNFDVSPTGATIKAFDRRSIGGGAYLDIFILKVDSDVASFTTSAGSGGILDQLTYEMS